MSQISETDHELHLRIEEARQQATDLFNNAAIRRTIFDFCDDASRSSLLQTSKMTFEDLAKQMYKVVRLENIWRMHDARPRHAREQLYLSGVRTIDLSGQFAVLGPFESMYHVLEMFPMATSAIWTTGKLERAENFSDTAEIIYGLDRDFTYGLILDDIATPTEPSTKPVVELPARLRHTTIHVDCHPLQDNMPPWPLNDAGVNLPTAYEAQSDPYDFPFSSLVLASATAAPELEAHLDHRRELELPEYTSISIFEDSISESDLEAIFGIIGELNASVRTLRILSKWAPWTSPEFFIWPAGRCGLDELRDLRIPIGMFHQAPDVYPGRSIRPECNMDSDPPSIDLIDGIRRYRSPYLATEGLKLRTLTIDISFIPGEFELPSFADLARSLLAFAGPDCQFFFEPHPDMPKADVSMVRVVGRAIYQAIDAIRYPDSHIKTWQQLPRAPERCE